MSQKTIKATAKNPIYVKDGVIDLDKNMGELGINDKPPLSESELKATIRDCTKARSGVYHPALYESERMKELKPERYSERGSGGHLVLIIPEYQMVIVHRADTDVKGKRIEKEALGSLVNLILFAKN